MALGLDPIAPRLDADQLDALVVEKGREDAKRVGAPTNARDHARRQTPLALQQLRARLVADHTLQIAHQGGVGRRTDDRADEVVGVADVRHPVADRRGSGLLECARAGVDGMHARPEQFHALHVRRLAARVLGTHVDNALEVEQRTNGGGGDAVLAGAGLGDDAALAHALGQQRLPKRIVELVRAGVVEILALEVNRPADKRGDTLGEIQRRGTSGEIAQQAIELCLVRGVLARGKPCLLQLGQRRHQRLGNVLPAIGPEAVLDCAHVGEPTDGVASRDGSSGEAVSVDSGAWGETDTASSEAADTGSRKMVGGAGSGPGEAKAARSTAAKKSRSFTGSLIPGVLSVPLAVSTANGRTRSIASPTLPGFKPPLRINGTFERRPASSPQSKVSPVPPRNCSCPGSVERASSKWKSVWKRAASWMSAMPDTCSALTIRAPVRRAASPQKEGPSSPCSCSSVKPSCSLMSTISSICALTNTPHSSTLRRRLVAMRCPSASEQARGDAS